MAEMRPEVEIEFTGQIENVFHTWDDVSTRDTREQAWEGVRSFRRSVAGLQGRKIRVVRRTIITEVEQENG